MHSFPVDSTTTSTSSSITIPKMAPHIAAKWTSNGTNSNSDDCKDPMDVDGTDTTPSTCTTAPTSPTSTPAAKPPSTATPSTSAIIKDPPPSDIPREVSTKKRLRFSDQIQIHVAERFPEEEESKACLSRAEKRNLMRQELRKKVARAIPSPSFSSKRKRCEEEDGSADDGGSHGNDYSAMKNGEGQDDDDDDEESLCTVGVEHLASRETCNELVQKRLELINAVLDEQERQDDLNIWDPEAIAFVSIRYSKWARERAKELGEEHFRCR